MSGKPLHPDLPLVKHFYYRRAKVSSKNVIITSCMVRHNALPHRQSIQMNPDLSAPPVNRAELLNSSCRCLSLDRRMLRSELAKPDSGDDLYRMLVEERPGLFAESAVFMNESSLRQQLDIIAALESVIALPAYQQHVLAAAEPTTRFAPKAKGVFLGYDFHLSDGGSKLIEINTNAGGALINSLLIRNQTPCCEIAEEQHPGRIRLQKSGQTPEQCFMTMFRQEWQAERGNQLLTSIAIVDDDPQGQYMLPEFVLFKELFAQQGLAAVICDPGELEYRQDGLWHAGRKIDLVYNRLTDFALTEDRHRHLREAYLARAVVLTPHPHAHALYADKRNLALFSDQAFLQDIGVDENTREVLMQGVAHTFQVTAADAERLWAERKQLFFKPAKGYGSKAAYRGDKLTRRVFNEILAHDYVAQRLVQPSHRQLDIADATVDLKLDIRHYVYAGQTQLICARLYQGQTTNFRTPGGGFAQIVVVSD